MFSSNLGSGIGPVVSGVGERAVWEISALAATQYATSTLKLPTGCQFSAKSLMPGLGGCQASAASSPKALTDQQLKQVENLRLLINSTSCAQPTRGLGGMIVLTAEGKTDAEAAQQVATLLLQLQAHEQKAETDDFNRLHLAHLSFASEKIPTDVGAIIQTMYRELQINTSGLRVVLYLSFSNSALLADAGLRVLLVHPVFRSSTMVIVSAAGFQKGQASMFEKNGPKALEIQKSSLRMQEHLVDLASLNVDPSVDVKEQEIDHNANIISLLRTGAYRVEEMLELIEDQRTRFGIVPGTKSTTALHLVASHNVPTLVKPMLKKFNVANGNPLDVKNEEGDSALAIAIRAQHAEMVKELLTDSLCDDTIASVCTRTAEGQMVEVSTNVLELAWKEHTSGSFAIFVPLFNYLCEESSINGAIVWRPRFTAMDEAYKAVNKPARFSFLGLTPLRWILAHADGEMVTWWCVRYVKKGLHLLLDPVAALQTYQFAAKYPESFGTTLSALFAQGAPWTDQSKIGDDTAQAIMDRLVMQKKEISGERGRAIASVAAMLSQSVFCGPYVDANREKFDFLRSTFADKLQVALHASDVSTSAFQDFRDAGATAEGKKEVAAMRQVRFQQAIRTAFKIPLVKSGQHDEMVMKKFNVETKKNVGVPVGPFDPLLEAMLQALRRCLKLSDDALELEHIAILLCDVFATQTGGSGDLRGDLSKDAMTNNAFFAHVLQSVTSLFEEAEALRLDVQATETRSMARGQLVADGAFLNAYRTAMRQHLKADSFNQIKLQWRLRAARLETLKSWIQSVPAKSPQSASSSSSDSTAAREEGLVLAQRELVTLAWTISDEAADTVDEGHGLLNLGSYSPKPLLAQVVYAAITEDPRIIAQVLRLRKFKVAPAEKAVLTLRDRLVLASKKFSVKEAETVKRAVNAQFREWQAAWKNTLAAKQDEWSKQPYSYLVESPAVTAASQSAEYSYYHWLPPRSFKQHRKAEKAFIHAFMESFDDVYCMLAALATGDVTKNKSSTVQALEAAADNVKGIAKFAVFGVEIDLGLIAAGCLKIGIWMDEKTTARSAARLLAAFESESPLRRVLTLDAFARRVAYRYRNVLARLSTGGPELVAKCVVSRCIKYICQRDSNIKLEEDSSFKRFFDRLKGRQSAPTAFKSLAYLLDCGLRRQSEKFWDVLTKDSTYSDESEDKPVSLDSDAWDGKLGDEYKVAVGSFLDCLGVRQKDADGLYCLYVYEHERFYKATAALGYRELDDDDEPISGMVKVTELVKRGKIGSWEKPLLDISAVPREPNGLM